MFRFKSLDPDSFKKKKNTLPRGIGGSFRVKDKCLNLEGDADVAVCMRQSVDRKFTILRPAWWSISKLIQTFLNYFTKSFSINLHNFHWSEPYQNRLMFVFIFVADVQQPEMETCQINVYGKSDGFVNKSDISAEVSQATSYNLPVDCMWRIEVEDGWKVITCLLSLLLHSLVFRAKLISCADKKAVADPTEMLSSKKSFLTSHTNIWTKKREDLNFRLKIKLNRFHDSVFLFLFNQAECFPIFFK